MHLLIRIVGTAAVAALLTYPLWAPDWGAGVLGEISLVPYPGNVTIIAGFFGLVALYCVTLQQTLRRTGAARPASVWWMFAIPANFVEDFYIVRRVGAALATRVSATAARRWELLGYGWCSFQIVSLLPGTVGLLGGALALVLWGVHWVTTLAINRRLR